MQIEGKVALVTGGASGLGAACVKMFIEAGGRALFIDLSDSLGEALAAEFGDSVRFVRADVTSPSEVQSAVDAALENFGALHVTINCAGIGGSKRIIGKEGAVDLDWFTKIVQVNLIGTFNVTRLAAAAMAKNEPDEGGERGVVVNTTSIAAFEGQIGQTAYSASKGGIVGMTLPLARDLARHAIRVATIAPGIFDTPLLGQLPEKIRKSLGEAVPNPARLGRPDEFAGLARHIIENSMLNGEVIRLDGALRMAPR